MKIAIHEFRSIKTLMFQDASCVVNLDILVTKLQENVNVLRLQPREKYIINLVHSMSNA
jgi:hypothetical protein